MLDPGASRRPVHRQPAASSVLRSGTLRRRPSPSCSGDSFRCPGARWSSSLPSTIRSQSVPDIRALYVVSVPSGTRAYAMSVPGIA
eukprot:3764917-Rhodomonas_salina.4